MATLVTLAELEAAAAALGSTLADREVIWLEGELGAGKTTFVQQLVRTLGVVEGATSPTYGLVHRYQASRGSIYHIDCYRLKRPDDARDLDWDGLSQGNPLLIEWPDRAGSWALPPTRRVRLAHADDLDRRWLEIIPCSS